MVAFCDAWARAAGWQPALQSLAQGIVPGSSLSDATCADYLKPGSRPGVSSLYVCISTFRDAYGNPTGYTIAIVTAVPSLFTRLRKLSIAPVVR